MSENNDSIRPPSRTALSAARSRAVHWLRGEEPKILEDWVAEKLLDYASSADLLADYDKSAMTKLPSMANLMVVRARFTEDEYRKAYQDHKCLQYVVIGAGLDSFAYRSNDKPDNCIIYEVDHPSSQHWKREKLSKAKIPIPSNVQYVPIDFEDKGSNLLQTALKGKGFDSTKPAFFSMLGVSQYISLESLKKTLLEIASSSSAKCTIVMERVPPINEGHLDEEEIQAIDQILKATQQMGEPWITFLNEQQTDTLFHEAGFKTIKHQYASDSERCYLQGRKNDKLTKIAPLVLAWTDGDSELSS